MDDTFRIQSVTGIDVELRVAGPGARSYAFVIDVHIRALAALAWFVAAFFVYFGGFTGVGPVVLNSSGFLLAVVLPTAAIYFLYHPLLEIVMHGRTPGKRIAGVRIVRSDGAIPGAGVLLVRNVFRLVDSLPLFYCVGLAATMLTRQAVRIGDLAAGTLLVYDEAAPDQAFDVSGSAVGALGLERAELVRDLLRRWPELRPDVREALGRKVLAGAGVSTYTADDNDLREALENLLH